MIRLSIVIPCLDEAPSLERRLARLARMMPGAEIIVADGGSTDGSRTIAARHARVVTSAPGRGVQMNAGARAASGEALLFVHADAELRRDPRTELASLLADQGCAGVYFRQRIAARGLAYRWIERAAFVRAKLFARVLGDLGLCVRADTFWRAGGYPEIALFEDLGISRRLRRLGRLAACETPLLVSARRWQRQGLVRTTCMNWLLTLGYLLGVSPDTLARAYRIVR